MNDEEFAAEIGREIEGLRFSPPDNISRFNEIFIWSCFQLARVKAHHITALKVLSGYKARSPFTRIKQTKQWHELPQTRLLSCIDFLEIAFALEVEINQTDLDRLSRCRTEDDVVRIVSELLHPTTEFEQQDREVTALVPRRLQDAFMAIDHGGEPITVPLPERWMHERIEPLLSHYPALVFSADCHSGLGHGLFTFDQTIELDYDKIIHVRPRAGRNNIDILFGEVLNELGIRGVEDYDLETLATMVERELRVRNVLLVLHNMHVVFDAQDWFETDLPSAVERGLRILFDAMRKRSNKCRIIATFATGLRPSDGLIEELNLRVETLTPPPLGKGDVARIKREILDLVHHYQDRAGRTIQTPNMIGSVGKRLHWYLTRLRHIKHGIGAATLRLRAAAIANPNILAEHDPTFGLRFLLGDDLVKNAPEFARLNNDILGALGCTAMASGAPQTALRLISCSLFWFSQEMAEHLRLKGGLVHVLDYPSWSTFQKTKSNPRRICYGYLSNKGTAASTRMTAPFAIRCVVQDSWRKEDPMSYIEVHQRIASNLMRLAKTPHDEALLPSEYPYDTPREGPALVWLASAIKHAARALRTLQEAPNLEAADRKALAPVKSELVKLLREGWANIERRPHSPPTDGTTLNERAIKHVLSHTEGRYLLRLELLLLLSKDGDGVAPLEFAPSSIKRRFHLNVGICWFGLLDLDRAQRAFRRGYYDNAEANISRFDSLMHRISVELFMLKTNEALAGIKEGEAMVSGLDEVDRSTAKGRIAVRQANRFRALGGKKNLKRAVAKYCQILDAERLVPITGDAAVACIDVLIEAYDVHLERSKDHLELGLVICETNASELGQMRYPHEVSRFDIRRARILARLGTCDAAEALLDSVALSLARDGGSERSLHEFQVAAADVLIRQGNAPWAYACYLHNSLSRSILLEYRLGARDLGKLVIQAMDACDAIASSAPNGPTAQTRAFVEAFQKQEQRSIWGAGASRRSKNLWSQLKRKNEAVDDPLFGYDLSALGRQLKVEPTDLAVSARRAKYRGLAEVVLGGCVGTLNREGSD